MNYNDIISLIVNDFNRSFNLSSEIIYDSRENIINKNPHFNELMNYTKVTEKNSKSSKMMANEKYYNYINKVIECFIEDKKIDEDSRSHLVTKCLIKLFFKDFLNK